MRNAAPHLRTSRWHASLAAGMLLAPGSVPLARGDEAKQLDYGRHLASECATCHRIDGSDNGIPTITGWDVSEFVRTLGFYRSGARSNQVMQSVAQSLDDDQVKALAIYYASMPRSDRKKR